MSQKTQRQLDLATVKETLGHSTVVMTMRYAHTNQEAKSKAVAVLDSSDRGLKRDRKSGLRAVTVCANDRKIR